MMAEKRGVFNTQQELLEMHPQIGGVQIRRQNNQAAKEGLEHLFRLAKSYNIKHVH